MKAIILASGKSTRLLPLTKDIHQCLLKVNNKTILEKQLELLSAAGIKDITLVCGYKSREVEDFCKKLGIKTIFNPFYEHSGVALTLWIAKQELKEDFIVLYSDILFDPEVIKGLLETKGDICIAIKRDKLREEAEKVVDENGIVKEITKQHIPGESGEFIGITKFSKTGVDKLIEILNQIVRTNLSASFIDAIGELIKQGTTLNSYDIKNTKYIDIDFPEDLKKAEELFK